MKLPPTWILLHAAALAVIVVFWVLMPTQMTDADNFWNVDPADPYREPWGGQLAYVYSPAFAQVISPLTLLPFDIFYKVWTGVSLAALAWLLTPVGAALALLIPLVRTEIEGGQIHLWLAVMVVIGLRYSPAWGFGLLTKVTPGVGVLWFAATGQWRKLAIGAVITGGVVLVSALIAPGAWADWIPLLLENSSRHMSNLALDQWPVVFRLPIAAGLVIVAAWRDRPAALPLITIFALPAIWPWSITLLAAIPRAVRR